jgi:hypothetical protein
LYCGGILGVCRISHKTGIIAHPHDLGRDAEKRSINWTREFIEVDMVSLEM